MGVSYDSLGSPLVIESSCDIWKAGKRCPDIRMSRVGNHDDEQQLYSMIPYGKFLILQLGTTRTPLPRFEEEAVHFNLVPRGVQHERIDDPKETWLTDKQVFSLNETSGEDSLVVIVRPDMYIGYVGNGNWLKTSKSSLVQGLLDQFDAAVPPSPTEKLAVEAVTKSGPVSRPWLQILGAFFLYFNTWGK